MTALMIASTAMSVYSSIREGQVANAQAKAQAESMRVGANISKMQAEATKKSGEYDEAKIKREKAKMLSTQQARYAKSGVLISEGSPLEVMADTASQYEMDISANRYNTAVQVAQKEYESKAQSSMADYYSSLGKAHKTSSYLKAGTTLLTSGYGMMKK